MVLDAVVLITMRIIQLILYRNQNLFILQYINNCYKGMPPCTGPERPGHHLTPPIGGGSASRALEHRLLQLSYCYIPIFEMKKI